MASLDLFVEFSGLNLPYLEGGGRRSHQLPGQPRGSRYATQRLTRQRHRGVVSWMCLGCRRTEVGEVARNDPHDKRFSLGKIYVRVPMELGVNWLVRLTIRRR